MKSFDESNNVDAEPTLDLSDKEVLKSYVRHTFANNPSSVPSKLEVNGRKGRRALCVIAEDKIHYQVLDIDPVEALNEVTMLEDEDMADVNEEDVQQP